MLIDPCSQTKLKRDFETPVSFLASLSAATLKKVSAVAAIECDQVERVIHGGGYGWNRKNSEVMRLYWIHSQLYEIVQAAWALADSRSHKMSMVIHRQPEPDTTYTMLDGLHKATLEVIKRAMVMEIEPLRKKRQEDGLDAMSGLELLRFSVLNDHLVMVNDILLRRGYPFLSLTNCINDRGALDIDDSLFISE